MEQWYRDFVADPEHAARALVYEYEAYSDELSCLTGNILDVGGGIGLPRAYLSSDANYIAIDPSEMWTEERWRSFVDLFPGIATRPTLVFGVGEQLPFANGSFDAALSFWSLNHVADPEKCICEIYRVMKVDAQFLLVLEDMEPSWHDVGRLAWQELKERRGYSVHNRLNWEQPGLGVARKIATHKLACRPWPLQPDHLRLTESELRRWLRNRFGTLDRSWRVGKYLTYRLVRRG